MARAETQISSEMTFSPGTPLTITQGILCVTFTSAGTSLIVNGEEYAFSEHGPKQLSSASDIEDAIKMTIPTEKSARITQGSLCVEFLATQTSLKINEIEYKLRPYEIAETLKDGTVVLSVDPEKNISVRLPQEIFGGTSTNFNLYGNKFLTPLNTSRLLGYNDWRHLSDKEADALVMNWNNLAPQELLGDAAPLFWLSPRQPDDAKRLRKGGDKKTYYPNPLDNQGFEEKPMPVGRTGPAWRLDI